ncbi:MAG: hypothetical protein IMY86_11740 [Chloroflexi bacterium]|nr:hypothetical protein [Chloroflexota bacterium]
MYTDPAVLPRTATTTITAHDSDALREQATRASVQRILDKPVGFVEIRSAVLEALGRQRKRRLVR